MDQAPWQEHRLFAGKIESGLRSFLNILMRSCRATSTSLVTLISNKRYRPRQESRKRAISQSLLPDKSTTMQSTRRPQAIVLQTCLLCARIDLDPVVSHGGAREFTGGFRHNKFCRFYGHMTVDAIVRDGPAHFLRYPATFPTMASETLVRVRCGGTLRSMHVMTGGTSHIRRLQIAFASLQQTYLVPVHIRVLRGVRGVCDDILMERLPGPIRKCGRDFLTASAVVAKGAQVHLPVSR
jgi:hypothetical protein